MTDHNDDAPILLRWVLCMWTGSAWDCADAERREGLTPPGEGPGYILRNVMWDPARSPDDLDPESGESVWCHADGKIERHLDPNARIVTAKAEYRAVTERHIRESRAALEAWELATAIKTYEGIDAIRARWRDASPRVDGRGNGIRIGDHVLRSVDGGWLGADADVYMDAADAVAAAGWLHPESWR